MVLSREQKHTAYREAENIFRDIKLLYHDRKKAIKSTDHTLFVASGESVPSVPLLCKIVIFHVFQICLGTFLAGPPMINVGTLFN